MMFGYSINSNKVNKHSECTYKTYNNTNYLIGDKLLIPKIKIEFTRFNTYSKSINDSLKPLVELLKKHSNIVFEIRCHTDYRDTDIHNQALTQRLAKNFKYYFIAQGIDSTRVKAKGMGESEPFIIDMCFHIKYPQFEIGDTLNKSLIMSLNDRKERETAHALNRRNEIVIMGIQE